jgi:hypothetical protein
VLYECSVPNLGYLESRSDLSLFFTFVLNTRKRTFWAKFLHHEIPVGLSLRKRKLVSPLFAGSTGAF